MTALTRPAVRVTLLTRTPCHLCDAARAIVADVCGRTGHAWQEVDVDSEPELRAEYGDQVPVVLVDGEQLSSFTVPSDVLRDALRTAR